jgi:predicted AAA+ superfamily ATPase
MRYIHRDIETTLKEAIKQFPAVAVTGPRQSGKSTLLQETLGREYKYVTFDDLAVRDRCRSDPKLFLSELDGKVILDEIQYVPELLSYVKIAIDKNRKRNGQFVITGSQQFNLIKNLGDTLAGRIALLTLLPFSCAEIRSKVKSKKGGSTKTLFVKACLKGSFPEIIVKPKMNLNQWYSSYIQTYLERDVRGLYGVAGLFDFQRFMKLLAGRCAQELNLSGLSNDLGVAVSTVKNWISILAASQIIFLLQPYYKNFGKRVVKSPKVYFTDCGLVAYLTGLKTRDLILFGPLSGPLFENYVVQESIKTLFAAGRQPEIYFYRTHKGLEADLIVPAGPKIIPFEIKTTKTPRPAMAQNIKKISDISSAVETRGAGIISLNEETFQLTKAAKVYKLPDYLKFLKSL